MDKPLLAFSVALLVMGVYALGPGITGDVVSQSCCFPPGCPAEYLCDAAEPHTEAPDQLQRFSSTATGILLIGGALLLAWHASTRGRGTV